MLSLFSEPQQSAATVHAPPTKALQVGGAGVGGTGVAGVGGTGGIGVGAGGTDLLLDLLRYTVHQAGVEGAGVGARGTHLLLSINQRD